MKRTYLPGGMYAPAALLMAGLAWTGSSAVLAANGPAQGGGVKVASAAVFAGGVDLLPEVRYREAVITVSGNGITFRRVVKAGGDLSIGVFDPEGQLLPDGVYKWELELVPGSKTAEKLRAAAALNGGEPPQAWRRESGAFTVRGGLVAAPDLVEPGPGPRSVAGSSPPAPLAGPSAERAAAGDDDTAVGSAKGVEARVQTAVASAPSAAPAAPTVGHRAFERSDAAAEALGGSAEPPLASKTPALAAPPVRQMKLDDPENGRDRSEENR